MQMSGMNGSNFTVCKHDFLSLHPYFPNPLLYIS